MFTFPRKSAIYSLVTAGLFLFAIVIFLSIRSIQASKDEFQAERDILSTGGSSSEATSDYHSPTVRSDSGRSQEVAAEKARQLRSQARDLFNDAEASRIKLLEEIDLGDAKRWILALPPPTGDVIQDLRESLADLTKKADPEYREEFDKWMTDLEDLYDPFGYTGNRVIVIYISEEAEGAVRAFSYSTNSFEGEADKFREKSVTVSFRNFKAFPSDEATLFRFKRFIDNE